MKLTFEKAMNIKYIVSGFLLVIAFAAGVLMLVLGLGGMADTTGYQRTTGYFNTWYVWDFDDKAEDRLYQLEYYYYVDDVQYTVRTDYGTSTLPAPGDERGIWYDPADPSKAVTEGTNSNSGLTVAGLMFTLIPVAMGVGIFMVSKGKNPTNGTDILFGGVMTVIAAGFLYLICDGFDVIRAFVSKGPWVLIPILMLAAGLLVLLRGIRGKRE